MDSISTNECLAEYLGRWLRHRVEHGTRVPFSVCFGDCGVDEIVQRGPEAIQGEWAVRDANLDRDPFKYDMGGVYWPLGGLVLAVQSRLLVPDEDAASPALFAHGCDLRIPAGGVARLRMLTGRRCRVEFMEPDRTLDWLFWNNVPLSWGEHLQPVLWSEECSQAFAKLGLSVGVDDLDLGRPDQVQVIGQIAQLLSKPSIRGMAVHCLVPDASEQGHGL